MLREDIESEIGKLKAKKAEISSRANVTRDFDTKENLKDAISNIDTQIKILENMRKK